MVLGRARPGRAHHGGRTAAVTQTPDSPLLVSRLPATAFQADLPSSEFGLAMGFLIGHYFLNMQDLHYGYWPQGLAVEPRNLAQAQAHYTEFLMQHIPAGVRTILDVGCGAGNTARKLLDRGYQVDAVSPNGVLSGVARTRISWTRATSSSSLPRRLRISSCRSKCAKI